MSSEIDSEFAAMLIERYGSPLYAYDVEEVERRMHELLGILPDRSQLYYSLKANPLPEIGAVLKEFCGAEVSSPGELDAALEAGFESDRIVYTGPGKSGDAVERALHSGVKHFSCESWRDADRLARVASGLGSRPRVLLRVNPSYETRGQLSMSRGAGQFGFSEESVRARPGNWEALTESLEFIGIHVYSGTQLHDSTALKGSFQVAIETAERVAEALSLECHVIDCGGGFPWPYATTGAGVDLSDLREPLAGLCNAKSGTSNRQYWFESGRYLSASSGTLLATVLDDKCGSDGRRYVVLDAGINVLGGMSGLGRVLTSSVAVGALGKGNAKGSSPADVVGPLCTPLDVIARDVLLPPLSSHSLVAIPNVGAYGLTSSLVAFLSHRPPAEVVYRGSEIIGARRLVMNREHLA